MSKYPKITTNLYRQYISVKKKRNNPYSGRPGDSPLVVVVVCVRAGGGGGGRGEGRTLTHVGCNFGVPGGSLCTSVFMGEPQRMGMRVV